MNKVVLRALSGAVYVAAIIGAILWGNWPFCVLTMIFAAIGIHEYFLMSHAPFGDKGRYTAIQVLDIVFAVLLPLSVMFMSDVEHLLMLILGVYLLVRATISLYDKGEHAYREVAKSMLGVIYIGLPMLMLNMLYNTVSDGPTLVLLMFVMIWLNDTGAFCFGITLGKHRLYERLSPKKSWEGFWGGMGCCIVFGAVCYYLFNNAGLELWQWLVLGALISAFSTWGDLFESMLKRTVNVKDSGTLIPGHGGILDRIDSLLFVAPVTLIFILLIQL